MSITKTVFEGRKHDLIAVFSLCWLGGACAGLNANLFSVLLPHAIADLEQTAARDVVSQTGSYILFVFLVGWMLGGIGFGMISDRLGRKVTMSLSIVCFSVFTGLAGLAQTSTQLGLCRFLIGLGVGGEMLTIAVFLSESWPEKSRAVALGALITSYQAGVFLSGFIAELIPQWRLAFVFAGLPIFLAAVIQWKLKEPEKWLLSSRESDARGKRNLLYELWQPGMRRNVLIGSVAFGAFLVGHWATLSWVPTWIHDLLGESALGHEKNYATMFHAGCAISGCLLAGFIANRIGRLPTIIGALLGGFVLSVWMFRENEQFQQIFYWQYSLLGVCIGMAQGALYIYLPELFPTHLRATSMGFCLNSCRVVTAFAVLLIGFLVPFFGGYSQVLTFFAYIYLAGVLACLFGQETKKTPIERYETGP